MSKQIELSLTPQQAFDPEIFKQIIIENLNVSADGDSVFHMLKRSIDARSRNITVKIVGEIVARQSLDDKTRPIQYPDVSMCKRALVIGAGPAGLFAALKLIQRGIK